LVVVVEFSSVELMSSSGKKWIVFVMMVSIVFVVLSRYLSVRFGCCLCWFIICVRIVVIIVVFIIVDVWVRLVMFFDFEMFLVSSVLIEIVVFMLILLSVWVIISVCSVWRCACCSMFLSDVEVGGLWVDSRVGLGMCVILEEGYCCIVSMILMVSIVVKVFS